MAEDAERTILIKNLENSKLRRRIKELEDKLATVGERAEEFLALETERETLKKCIEETKAKHSLYQAECKNKLRQLQENNQKLMEEVVAGQKVQLRAEEENVAVNEKNFQLIYDFKILQQKNEKMQADIQEIQSESLMKNRELKNAENNFAKARQQNECLKEEILKLTASVNAAKLEGQKKESTIKEITHHLEETSVKLHQQEIMESKILKLQTENEALQTEVKQNYENIDRTAEILLNNKEILAENKKLKIENEAIHKQNTNIRNEKHEQEEKIEELKKILTASQEKLVTLKKLDLVQECDVRQQNEVLKIKLDNTQIDIKKLNQVLVNVLKENSGMKEKIQSLENSNAHKLIIITKLKTGTIITADNPDNV